MDNELTNLISRSLPLLLKGAGMTVQILLSAGILSLILGVFFGVMTCRRLRLKAVAPFIEMLAFVLRAVPLYVQLLIVYFVLPDLLNISLDSYTASLLALGVCSSGYVAQIIRCGINSIPVEQWESALTLGYSTPACVRYIIFPQMIRNILPALTNEFDSLLKSTAILSSIGLLELTRMGMNIVSREMEPLTIYLAVAVFYIAMSGVINLLSKHFEKQMNTYK